MDFKKDFKKFLPFIAVGVVSAATTVGAYSFVQSKTNPNNDDQYFKVANKNAQLASMSIGPDGQGDFVKASKLAVPAVVAVKNYQNNPDNQQQQSMQDLFGFFFGQPQQQQPQQQMPSNIPTSLGSGVIISPDGYIITNNHVIKGADKIEVQLTNQKTYIAKLVGTDPNTDIALLKIDASGLPYLNFGNSDLAPVGEWVLAIGNPLGLNSTVTAGIISAKDRTINILNSSAPIESYIQTDAPINRGNSGGALIDMQGNLIGINSAILAQTGYYEGYGFAVPSNLARKVVDDLKKYGIVQRAFLGVTMLDLSNDMLVKQYNFENKTKIKTGAGVYVLETTPDSAAKAAGLKAGDVITGIDGKSIMNAADLSLIIGLKRPGDRVNVTYVRDGQTRSVTATLRNQNGNDKTITENDLTVAQKLGAQFQNLTERQKVYFGINNGVGVSRVSSNGLLASIGMNQGDIITSINGKAVNSTDDIDKILKGYKGQVNIKYLNDNGQMISRGFKMN